MSPSSITHRAVLFPRVLKLLTIMASLVPLGVPTRASSMMPQCRFDPDGYFYIKGSSPHGFEEVDYIQLHVTPHRERRPPPISRLDAKNGRLYEFAKLAEFRTDSSGAGITFEFTTKTIKGVHYQFSGKFIAICVFAQDERDPEKTVAVGRLVKFEKGKQKRAADVELTYSKSPRQQTGREVLAILRKIELKAYTDDLGNGKALVSDLFRFEVVEPKELTHVRVIAYYRGAPDLQGKRLQAGDLVRFELPPEPQRDGILLWDLKGLRFRE